MFDLLREHQLNFMLVMSGICVAMGILMLFTRFLPQKRKWILVVMELFATLLVSFDRLSYLYNGDISDRGYAMVRIANFIVFFITPAIVLVFNLYLCNLLFSDGRFKDFPMRLNVVSMASLIGMVLAVVSQFTGLYYTFDPENRYIRSHGFVICYIVPVICPLIQFSVIVGRRKKFSKLIFISLVLYIFVPIIFALIQIFAYGLSLVNMALALVSVGLYIFTYLDINEEVIRTHRSEMQTLEKERGSMKRLFEQTAVSFVQALDERDKYRSGHSLRVADLARKIAKHSGRSEDECDDVYFSALVHDVGMITLPTELLGREDDLTEEEEARIRAVPEAGAGILSGIKEYPDLADGARYSCERYDGSGYPEGRKGAAIPYTARIISAADAFDDMAGVKRTRGAIPPQVIREEFVKDSGSRFDPDVARIIVHMLDTNELEVESEEEVSIESQISADGYRSAVTAGIPVTADTEEISFLCERLGDEEGAFSQPSIILFDSFDRHIHDNPRSIEAYHYVEYGEVWFDGHYISTEARNMNVEISKLDEGDTDNIRYTVSASRFEDHVKLVLTSNDRIINVTVALPDSSKSAYIALTGENCRLYDIAAGSAGTRIGREDITRIADKISYIDRFESDIPNVQIDRTRSAYSEGVKISDGMRILFHSMSLPTASLVWHCPYIVLYYSEDGKVGGKGYREYTIIKLNGENEGDDSYSENTFTMKKSESFPGWDDWKETNLKGMEFEIGFLKKKEKISLVTENLGVFIENITVIKDGNETVYAAITGDQCAVTDIRIES